MLPAENLTQFDRWLVDNIASLTAATHAAHSPRSAQQVEERAAQLLQVLEARDRAAVAALEAIRQEIAAGRPYRQHKTTWTRRLAALDQETAAYNQARALLQDHMAVTRQMLAQLQQRQRPAPQLPDANAPGFQASVSPPAFLSGISRPAFIKNFVSYSLIVLLSLAVIGALTSTFRGSPAPQVATPLAPPAPTEGPATEAADLYQEPSAPPPATPTPAAALATATRVAPTPTIRPIVAPSPLPTSTPAPTPTPATLANTDANLRTGPGTNYPLAGALTLGQAVKVIARNPAGDWYQLAGGAWIYSPLLSNAPVVPVAAVIPTAPPPTATATRIPPTATPIIVIQPPAAPVRACCKICTTGKACGNTCIARNKTCHVGPGCACDG